MLQATSNTRRYTALMTVYRCAGARGCLTLGRNRRIDLVSLLRKVIIKGTVHHRARTATDEADDDYNRHWLNAGQSSPLFNLQRYAGTLFLALLRYVY